MMFPLQWQAKGIFLKLFLQICYANLVDYLNTYHCALHTCDGRHREVVGTIRRKMFILTFRSECGWLD